MKTILAVLVAITLIACGGTGESNAGTIIGLSSALIVIVLGLWLGWWKKLVSGSTEVQTPPSEPQAKILVKYSITSMQSEQPVRGIVTFNGVTEGTVTLPIANKGDYFGVGEVVKLRFTAINPDVFTKGYFYLPDYGNKVVKEETGNSGSFDLIWIVEKP